MEALLLSLILVLIYLAVVALIFGVVIWALTKLFPATPPIVVNALYVIAVLVALYILASWFFGLPLPRSVR